MKLLMLFVHEYWLEPYEKSLPEAPDVTQPVEMQSAVVALIHVEAHDAERHAKLVTKAIKQIKWLARKFASRNVVLHSFAHLATTTAEPRHAEQMLSSMQERLTRSGYTVQTTPFGYFNEFRLHVAGPSLAKVFADL